MLTNLFAVTAPRWQFTWITAGLLWTTVVADATTSRLATDYEGIVKRNPFNLQPPPPPPPPPAPPPTPPSNIELTGLSTAFNQRRVFMAVKDAKGQLTHKALSVGDPADEGIEVLSLDISAGEVRVRNRGVESLLTLKQNAAKVPVGAVPVPLAPVIPVQPSIPTLPGTIGADGMPAGLGEAAPAGAGGANAPRVIPTRSIRVPQPQTGQPTSQATPQLNFTPEVESQIIQMEINKLINSGGPPLPPTPFSNAQP